jgi:ribosomal protein S18 acetylase RimI-like enzyme
MRVWVATPDEADDVTRLLVGFRDWWGRGWPDDASFRESVELLIRRDDTEFLLAAADHDGPPTGVAQLRYRWSVWWAAEDCWLEDLYVEEEARGAGMGRALVDVTLDRARDRACRRVELDVNSENAAARALYESAGFTTGKGGGQDLLMRRQL